MRATSSNCIPFQSLFLPRLYPHCLSFFSSSLIALVMLIHRVMEHRTIEPFGRRSSPTARHPRKHTQSFIECSQKKKYVRGRGSGFVQRVKEEAVWWVNIKTHSTYLRLKDTGQVTLTQTWSQHSYADQGKAGQKTSGSILQPCDQRVSSRLDQRVGTTERISPWGWAVKHVVSLTKFRAMMTWLEMLSMRWQVPNSHILKI